MTLFAAYVDLGRKSDALTQLPKIFADPKANTARDYFIMAEELRQAGLTEQAERFYRKAYELDHGT